MQLTELVPLAFLRTRLQVSKMHNILDLERKYTGVAIMYTVCLSTCEERFQNTYSLQTVTLIVVVTV